MIKRTIADTPFGEQLKLRKRGLEAATFLAKNSGSILAPDGIEYLQSTVRPTVSTPFVEIYNKASELGKLSGNFTMFDLSRTVDCPSVLTMPDVAIDGKYISTNMPSSLQNAWLDLTPILGRRDAYNRTLQIRDVLRFAALVSRSLLCMSYNDSDAWLTPILATKIIECYSLLIGLHLKNTYNLNFDEYGFVRTLFAAYMAQMLDSPKAPQEIPPLLYRCRFLYQDTGTPRSIDERFEKVAELRQRIAPDNRLDIDIVCQLIAGCGPSRMAKLTAHTLYAFMTHSPMDNQNMSFALDYPPYFVYLLLDNMKGGKNGLIINLLKFGDLKKDMNVFVQDLLSTKLFIEKIKR